MDRRTLLKTSGLALASLGVMGMPAVSQAHTTNQPDTEPLKNELSKYPKCTICNMDRTQFHFSRHLLHYADGHAEGACSINCASECMVRSRKRGFAAIYAADYGNQQEIKPLTEVSAATYLIGAKLRPVMSKVSKYAFAERAAAEAVMAEAGGRLTNFDEAVAASLQDYASMVSQRYASRHHNTDDTHHGHDH